MKYSIRPVRNEDAASIIDLLNPIIQAGIYTILDQQLSVEDQLEFIRGFPERGVFHVAVLDDSQRVVGLQDVQPFSPATNALKHVGEIATFVAMDAQRKGIGRSLSRTTFRAAKEKGFTKLWASIRADNPQAISFYQSQDFEVIGTARKHALVGGKYIDEILAERFIE